jgi:Flp pilus assembly protein TadG
MWRAQLRLRKCRKDEAGHTAVEFAMVSLPFVMLLFGIIAVCLYFFTVFTMENAVWQAARAIRTGQFQQGLGIYAGLKTDEDRKKAFKAALCEKSPAYIECEKAVVMVQSNSGGFGSISPPLCASDGSMVDQSKAEFNPGGASSVVLVTVCYPWSFGGKLPFLATSNLNDGSLLIQASVTFRTEPFPTQ